MQPTVIKRADHPISRKNIDEDALRVLYKLYHAGHTVYLVGGGVRDMLLGRQPKDFDVATSARPSQVKKLFKRGCHLVGRRFLLAHVLFGADKIIEVSTFRRAPDLDTGVPINENEAQAADDGYICSDNTFGTPEQDAQRRDFTINSLFYDIGTYCLLDYCGGVEDLQRRIIRTIGDPQVRFREDPVRMLRAIKFCARLDFRIDDATWQGILDNHQAISYASTARVQEEIRRLLESRCSLRCFELLHQSGLLKDIVPEIQAYLQRAVAGKVPYDGDGRLLWHLLAGMDGYLGDISDANSRRELACYGLILPLALEAGLLRGTSSDAVQQVIAVMGERLGLCNRVRDGAWKCFSMIEKMINDRNIGDKKSFAWRERFQGVFVLYSLLVDCGLGEIARRDDWRQFFSSEHNAGVGGNVANSARVLHTKMGHQRRKACRRGGGKRQA